jgi:hypothetical protein
VYSGLGVSIGRETRRAASSAGSRKRNSRKRTQRTQRNEVLKELEPKGCEDGRKCVVQEIGRRKLSNLKLLVRSADLNFCVLCDLLRLFLLFLLATVIRPPGYRLPALMNQSSDLILVNIRQDGVVAISQRGRFNRFYILEHLRTIAGARDDTAHLWVIENPT